MQSTWTNRLRNYSQSFKGKLRGILRKRERLNPRTMHLIRPKIIGTLKINKMMAGNWAVMNDIKNPPNKIIVPCRSLQHGEEIIEKIKAAKPGETIHI